MNISIDRIVAFLGPPIATVGTGIATWLVAHVNVLGIPGLDKSNVATWIAGGVTAILVAGMHALAGWKFLTGRHIMLLQQRVSVQGPPGPTGPPGSLPPSV